jgi:hypothetical protein
MDSQQYAAYKRRERIQSIKTGIGVSGLILFVAGGFTAIGIYGNHRANQEKQNFTNSCTSIHGFTFEDSDNYNCLVNGKVLFKTAK